MMREFKKKFMPYMKYRDYSEKPFLHFTATSYARILHSNNNCNFTLNTDPHYPNMTDRSIPIK